MKAPPPRQLGRFQLRRPLGQGAQASVWLAHDPRLEREVAVKLLNRHADARSLSRWLHEARAVSRLTHPNIVPVFEADEHEGQPYLVFEYVTGPTLAEALRQRVGLPASQAVPLMIGVLDALAAAHLQGIVHRDLKPSNILLGSDGRARVMDFGIAERVSSAAGGVFGTPGYISPEAALGQAPAPAMDVFSAGLVLAEMLSGSPLLDEPDAQRALQIVRQEDLSLPATLAIDDALRGIVQRALARDPHQRHSGAAAMRDALSAWLKPAEPAPAESSGHGTLDFLLRRIRHKGDFPALSQSMLRIQRLADSESESLASLSGEILKDVALTNKLLRMVNAAHFSAGGGSVSTVSRAVALVGLSGIRNMALSLVLLEHMRDKAHAALLKDEFVRALLAATLADALTPNPKDGEEAFLGSLFQNLGRLLTEYYFPEEAQQVRHALPAGEHATAQRDAAAQRVLGIGFDELGAGVARSWGLPDTLLRTMRSPVGAAPARAADRGVERQRWVGRASNEIAEAMLMADGPAKQRWMDIMAERFAPAIGLRPADLLTAAQDARQRLAQLAPAMGLHTAPGSAARRLLQAPPSNASTDSLSPHQLQPTISEPAPAGGLAAADVLAAGIQDITTSMVADDFKLNEVLRMVLETMYRALAFRRVVFCLRDSKAEVLSGRFGLGEGAEAVSRAFRVPLRGAIGNDLFHAVCAKGVDSLIQDASAANIASRLPEWYRQSVHAPAFLLLPLMLKGSPFALIYADKAEPGSIALGEKELALLRTLRNQACIAFRQSGGG
jgi:serine/threonine protein kinase